MSEQPKQAFAYRPLGPGDVIYDRLASEVQYFRSVREKLWSQLELRSKYVAIYKHAIVDTDQDKFSLSKRMDAKYPGEVVLITLVDLNDHTFNLPSPEMV